MSRKASGNDVGGEHKRYRRALFDLFWACLQVCFDNDNMAMYRCIWEAWPNDSKKFDSIWKYRSNSAIIGLRVYMPAIFSKARIWDYGTLRMVLWNTLL